MSDLKISKNKMKFLGYRVFDMIDNHFERIREKTVTRYGTLAKLEELLHKIGIIQLQKK